MTFGAGESFLWSDRAEGTDCTVWYAITATVLLRFVAMDVRARHQSDQLLLLPVPVPVPVPVPDPPEGCACSRSHRLAASHAMADENDDENDDDDDDRLQGLGR